MLPSIEILRNNCTTGFTEHVNLNRTRQFDDNTLKRQRLLFRRSNISEQSDYIKRVILSNSSLRVYIGWSFESTEDMKGVFDDCRREIGNNQAIGMPAIVSDFRADWFGFMPYNAFEQENYENLSLYGLISFNNSLIDYQTDVIKFVYNHPTYQDHALCRDESFRFEYFKKIRKNKDDLEDAFNRYMQALENTTRLSRFSKDDIEQSVGVHYLHYPDLFFRLVGFYVLKGVIYE